MKREPDFAEARPKRRYLYKSGPHARKPSKLVQFFSSPVIAFVVLFGMALLTIPPYWILHTFRPAKEFEPTKAFGISDDGRFEPIFIDGDLERFFSKAAILQFKEEMKLKTEKVRERSLRNRRIILPPVIRTLNTWLRDSSVILQLSVTSKQNKVPDAPTDDELMGYRIADLARSLGICDDSGVRFPPDKLPAVREFARHVDDLDKLEQKERGILIKEINSLNSPLSFGWLYVEGAKWIIEVTFWSFLGVIANTVIALIISCRAGRYSAGEFVLVFPKVFLAPLLAVVFVALWSTGISESKISYLNLPYFLVFSFLLGFGTEGLYEKLRELTALIVTPAATLSQRKLEELGRNVPYQYQTTAVKPADLPVARTFAELEKNMSAAIKSRIERSVVARSAIND